MTPADLQTLQSILHADAGLLLESGKDYLINGRLEPIAHVYFRELLLRKVAAAGKLAPRAAQRGRRLPRRARPLRRRPRRGAERCAR